MPAMVNHLTATAACWFLAGPASFGLFRGIFGSSGNGNAIHRNYWRANSFGLGQSEHLGQL